MSVDSQRNTPPEFSVREGFGGKLVLRVREFETLPYSGLWRDAQPGDLPTFFEYMQRGRPSKP